MFCLKLGTFSDHGFMWKKMMKCELSSNFHSKKLEEFSQVFQNFAVLETTVKYLEINEILISTDPRLIFIKCNSLCWKKIQVFEWDFGFDATKFYA